LLLDENALQYHHHKGKYVQNVVFQLRQSIH
jgi:hypothetical protein